MDLLDQLRDHVDLFDQMNEQLLDFLQVGFVFSSEMHVYVSI